MLIDAELARLRQSIAQSALLQAIESDGAFAYFSLMLQLVFLAQVFVQPRRAHRSCRQTGHAH
jgi:hypothetical protein